MNQLAFQIKEFTSTNRCVWQCRSPIKYQVGPHKHVAYTAKSPLKVVNLRYLHRVALSVQEHAYVMFASLVRPTRSARVGRGWLARQANRSHLPDESFHNTFNHASSRNLVVSLIQGQHCFELWCADCQFMRNFCAISLLASAWQKAQIHKCQTVCTPPVYHRVMLTPSPKTRSTRS